MAGARSPSTRPSQRKIEPVAAAEGAAVATTPAAAVAVVEAAVAADTNQLRMSERSALSGGLFTRVNLLGALERLDDRFIKALLLGLALAVGVVLDMAPTARTRWPTSSPPASSRRPARPAAIRWKSAKSAR